jgi:alpha-L-fucosidase 2
MTSADCTMDMALIRELFGNCIATSRLLGIDFTFAASLEASVARLQPLPLRLAWPAPGVVR